MLRETTGQTWRGRPEREPAGDSGGHPADRRRCGTNNATGDITPIASLGVVQTPSFTISASPASLSIPQGNQELDITTTISGGFNADQISPLRGCRAGPRGFAPQTIPSPGAGSSTMTITAVAAPELSHHRYGEWGRHPAEHYRHADRDCVAQLHDFGLAGFAQHPARQSGHLDDHGYDQWWI